MKRILTLVLLASGLALGWHLVRRAGTSAPPARRVAFYRDPMHPSYRSDRPGKAPDCGMELEPVYDDAPGDPQAIAVDARQRAMLGLTVAPVAHAPVSRAFRTFGRVTYDEGRVFPVRAGCDGLVTKIRPDVATGSSVRKGQVLATVYGRDYTTAQRSFLYALRAAEAPAPPSSDEDARQNVLSLADARRYLETLGIGAAQIGRLESSRQVGLDVDIVAPAAGIVVTRNVSPDQRFERGAELFRIADVSRVWILVPLSADDRAGIRPGDRAEVLVPGPGGSTMRATVSPAALRYDETSRNLELRLETDNAGRTLAPGMAVDVSFTVDAGETTTVPTAAIVETAEGDTVYVDSGDGTFSPRRIKTGRRFGETVEVLSGVSSGDSVVVSGQALLSAETRLRHGNAGLHD